jgi:uncharacterized membrane protein
MNREKQRFWEIDLLRGIAIIMMITYHILFDLDFLGIISFPFQSISFRLFLYPIGTLFLVLVGVSLVISYNQYKLEHGHSPPFKKYLKRGVFLFFLALVITLVTWMYPHDGFILFGVIHCIGISIILSYFFISKPKISLFTGLLLLIIGIFFMNITISNSYLFWLGLKTSSFYTLDYFPLLPWFGIVLIGLFIGQKIYLPLQRKYNAVQITPLPFRALTFLGRNSLIIYIVHQPVLFAILFVLF